MFYRKPAVKKKKKIKKDSDITKGFYRKILS